MPQVKEKVHSIAFPFYNSDGKVVNVKYRDFDKNFTQTKGGEQIFYGLKTFPIGDTTAIIVEGEIDSLTMDEVGLTYNLSVPNGANSIKFLNKHKDFLDPIETFIIAVDDDKAGNSLKKKLIDNLDAEKCWTIEYPDGCKDINDVLMNHGKQKVMDVINNAMKVPAPKRTIKSITDYNLTDTGSGEFFADQNRGKVIYNHSMDKWYIWNGAYWEPDRSNKIRQFAKETARKFGEMAFDIEDRDKSEEYVKFSYKLENSYKSRNMLKFAKSEQGIASTSDEFDQKKYLVQFENGVYDLQNMEFREGNPKDMITKSVGYDYDPDAECSRFRQFTDEIFVGDVDLINYVKKYIGYTLSGEVSDQTFLILHGSGENGKSVLLETLKRVLGEYAKNTSFSTFATQYGNSIPNDIARLAGSRLVTCSELSGKKKNVNEERLKSITGGDELTARFMRKEFFDFRPQFKLYLAINNLPKIEDHSHGFWRRVRLIPFLATFKGEDRDPDLPNKLMKEVPGIMNYAIEGYRLYKEEGLEPPAVVDGAVNKYRGDNDLMAKFFSKCCEYGDHEVKASELYDHFVKWIEKNYSCEPLSKTKFGRNLSNFGKIEKVKRGGQMYYQGLKLRDDLVEANNIPF